MNEFLVDTNVILDLIGADEKFGPVSKDCLTRCASNGVLVINPVVYAEVGAVIEAIEELNELLPTSLFRRDPLPWDAAYLSKLESGMFTRLKYSVISIIEDQFTVLKFVRICDYHIQ